MDEAKGRLNAESWVETMPITCIILLYRVNDNDIANDLVQETFCRHWKVAALLWGSQ